VSIVEFLGRPGKNGNLRKEKIKQNVSSSLVAIFVKLVKSRILIDYHYYRLMHDFLSFEVRWCLNKVLCEIVEEELLFSIFYFFKILN